MSDVAIDEVFAELRSILMAYADDMEVSVDEDDEYILRFKDNIFAQAFSLNDTARLEITYLNEDDDILEDISKDLSHTQTSYNCFEFDEIDDDAIQDLDDFLTKVFLDAVDAPLVDEEDEDFE